MGVVTMMRATPDDEQPTLNLEQKQGTQLPSKARTPEGKKRANHKETDRHIHISYYRYSQARTRDDARATRHDTDKIKTVIIERERERR